MNKKNEEAKIESSDKEMKELVIARLKTMSSDKKISIGSAGDFTRDELIERVEKGDELGQKIIEIQMEYLRLLKEGIFYERSSAHYEAKA